MNSDHKKTLLSSYLGIINQYKSQLNHEQMFLLGLTFGKIDKDQSVLKEVSS